MPKNKVDNPAGDRQERRRRVPRLLPRLPFSDSPSARPRSSPRTQLEPVHAAPPRGFPWGFPITFPSPTSLSGRMCQHSSPTPLSPTPSAIPFVSLLPISSCSFSIFRLSNRDLSRRASLLLPPSSSQFAFLSPCRDSPSDALDPISELICAPLVLSLLTYVFPSLIWHSSCPYWLMLRPPLSLPLNRSTLGPFGRARDAKNMTFVLLGSMCFLRSAGRATETVRLRSTTTLLVYNNSGRRCFRFV